MTWWVVSYKDGSDQGCSRASRALLEETVPVGLVFKLPMDFGDSTWFLPLMHLPLHSLAISKSWPSLLVARMGTVLEEERESRQEAWC